MKATTKSGDSILLNVSPDTGFGFAPGDIVYFSKSRHNGKVALVRGVFEGMLWFSVFPTVHEASAPEALEAAVDTATCRSKEELIRQFGWVLEDASNPTARGGS
ncbi:uncharacterized protein TEOVI_000337600 [Trypanosoma equiperdum]|uniref:Uncharacterized protein n=2 Tax=Trypanozoon TaxID=39700 RepID=Q57Z44_TRYB2|nr:hypothetical protein, conserved [Trypanosoma brucei brucei TREU927]AAX80606.1 hypothetical protein, conserved [Trypanosoma brucei]AAZ11516.1 hypothetical protein, conserved [Trypanosoma brucei brucei TREU927]SCU71795.1 hypothetical protein, conserved [Trypanosoma equiperdum]